MWCLVVCLDMFGCFLKGGYVGETVPYWTPMPNELQAPKYGPTKVTKDEDRKMMKGDERWGKWWLSLAGQHWLQMTPNAYDICWEFASSMFGKGGVYFYPSPVPWHQCAPNLSASLFLPLVFDKRVPAVPVFSIWCQHRIASLSINMHQHMPMYYANANPCCFSSNHWIMHQTFMLIHVASGDAVAISFKLRGVPLEPLLQAKPLMKAPRSSSHRMVQIRTVDFLYLKTGGPKINKLYRSYVYILCIYISTCVWKKAHAYNEQWMPLLVWAAYFTPAQLHWRQWRKPFEQLWLKNVAKA